MGYTQIPHEFCAKFLIEPLTYTIQSLRSQDIPRICGIWMTEKEVSNISLGTYQNDPHHQQIKKSATRISKKGVKAEHRYAPTLVCSRILLEKMTWGKELVPCFFRKQKFKETKHVCLRELLLPLEKITIQE